MADESRKPKRKKAASTALNDLLELNRKTKKNKASCIVTKHDPVTWKRISQSPYRPRASRGGKVQVERAEDGDIPDECVEWPGNNTTEDNNGDALQRHLNEAEELTSGWGRRQALSQIWVNRMAQVNSGWEEARPVLFENMLRIEGRSGHCSKCGCHGSVRCRECGTLCYQCDQDCHECFPLHDREVLYRGCFIPVCPTTALDSGGDLIRVRRHLPLHSKQCFSCGDCMEVEYAVGQHTLVSIKGRYDLDVPNRLVCSPCGEKRDVRLNNNDALVLGLWPGTPSNPSQFFEQELLRFWDMLQKRVPGVSERAFLSALEDFSEENGRVGTINITTFNRSYKEWKFCQFEMEKLQSKNWMQCPPCYKEQHSAHVDGNMKLYRFKSAGGLEFFKIDLWAARH